MTIRLMLAVLLLGTATAHAQIAGAGGASPEANATRRQPIGAKHGDAPRLLKERAGARPVEKSAVKPAKPRPATPHTQATVNGR